MPPHLPVRRATLGDLDAIVQVTNAAYRVEEFFIVGDRTDAIEVAELLTRPDSAFLVVDGQQPGTLAGSVEVESRGDRGYFGLLAVDPARQGEGIARALLGAVEDYFRSRGCHTLELTVVDLRTELMPFYAAFGFAPTGRTPEFERDVKLRRPAHLIEFAKSLRLQP